MSRLLPLQPAQAQRVGTVMIVDDEMMVTSSLQTMLSLETTHRIHCFNSPMEALAHVQALHPDVVISDFSMPGMDGIAFLKEVKALLPETTLILLTGYADKKNAIQAINTVGIYRYLEKPWDNHELKLSIHNGLERSHLIGDLQQSIQELSAARTELEQTNRHLEQLVEARTREWRSTFQKLESIVQNTADGILTLDQDLRVTALNPAAEGWLRRAIGSQPMTKAQPWIGQPIEALLKSSADYGKAKPKPIRQSFCGQQVMTEVLMGDLPLEASIAPLKAAGSASALPPEQLLTDPVNQSEKVFYRFLTNPVKNPEIIEASEFLTGLANQSKMNEVHELGTNSVTHSLTEGYVVVLRDITARKEIERLRDDFVSTLTHDLRTPLLAAIQTLGFFVDGSLGVLSPRQEELITMLVQSNRELLGLVNVLLEVYKYESGRQKLIVDAVNLSALIESIGQELQALARQREQELVLAFAPLEAAPDTSLDASVQAYRVQGDKQELKRVFVNLMGNAINFTPKGGKIHVAVSIAPQATATEPQTKPRIRVCITDTGRGIPTQDLSLLFQRFSQGTSKQRSSGSGLGLYLSRQIVEAHAGAIWVESEENVGSRFYVELPQFV
jgi:signal transduction histidine kinase/FixJ family two-component response regulator